MAGRGGGGSDDKLHIITSSTPAVRGLITLSHAHARARGPLCRGRARLCDFLL